MCQGLWSAIFEPYTKLQCCRLPRQTIAKQLLQNSPESSIQNALERSQAWDEFFCFLDSSLSVPEPTLTTVWGCNTCCGSAYAGKKKERLPTVRRHGWPKTGDLYFRAQNKWKLVLLLFSCLITTENIENVWLNGYTFIHCIAFHFILSMLDIVTLVIMPTRRLYSATFIFTNEPHKYTNTEHPLTDGSQLFRSLMKPHRHTEQMF